MCIKVLNKTTSTKLKHRHKHYYYTVVKNIDCWYWLMIELQLGFQELTFGSTTDHHFLNGLLQSFAIASWNRSLRPQTSCIVSLLALVRLTETNMKRTWFIMWNNIARLVLLLGRILASSSSGLDSFKLKCIERTSFGDSLNPHLRGNLSLGDSLDSLFLGQSALSLRS